MECCGIFNISVFQRTFLFLPFPLFPLYFLRRTRTHTFALNGMVALYLGTPGRRTNCGGTGIKVQDSHHRSEYKEDDEPLDLLCYHTAYMCYTIVLSPSPCLCCCTPPYPTIELNRIQANRRRTRPPLCDCIVSVILYDDKSTTTTTTSI